MAKTTTIQQYKFYLTRESDEVFERAFGETTRLFMKSVIEALELNEKYGYSYHGLAKQLGVSTSHLTRHRDAYHEAVRQLREEGRL